MPDLAQLAVKVTPQGITTTDDQLDKLGRTAEGTEKRTKSMMDKFKDMQAVMQGPVAAARSVVGGLQQVIAVGADLVNSYKVQEQAVSNLNAVLAATGGTVGMTSQELQDMASSLQSVTTFGDEAIIGMNAVLLGFRSITGDQFTRTTEAIMDMSQVMGQDLVSSANMVGKALDSPTQGMAALSRVGFVWTDQQREMVKAMEESGDLMGAQEVILGELEKAFGGAARAAGETATGSFDQLANSLGDLKEELGAIVALTFKADAKGLTALAGDTAGGLKLLREAFSSGDNQQALDAAEKFLSGIQNRIKQLSEEVKKNPFKAGELLFSLPVLEAESLKLSQRIKYLQETLAAEKALEEERRRLRGGSGGGGSDDGAADRRAAEEEAARAAEQARINKIAAAHIKEVTDAMNERLRVAQLEAVIRGEELSEQDRLNILYESYVDLIDPAKYVSANNSAAQSLEARIDKTRELAEEELAAENTRKEAEEAAKDRAAEMARAVVDLTEKYKTQREQIAEQIQSVNELWQGGYISLDLYQEALIALSREMEEATAVVDEAAQKASDTIKDLTGSLAGIGKGAALDTFEAIGFAIASGAEGAKSFEEAMIDVGASILQQLPMLLLNAGLQLVAVGAWPAGLALIAASGLVAIGAGAVSYAQGQSSSGVTANALGGVYGSPSLSAYSNGVYNSPQMFAFAKGAGVFAEAGAEAIMPLERDASGRLGVSASGSGASVEVIINNMAPGTQVTQEERTGPDGTRQVVATVKSIVKSMGRDGELDGVMGRYGLSPQGVRR